MPSNKQVWVSKDKPEAQSSNEQTNQQTQQPQTQNRGRGSNKPRGRGGYKGKNSNNKGKNQSTNSTSTPNQTSSTNNDNIILDNELSEVQHDDEHVHESISQPSIPQPLTTKKTNNNSNNTMDNNKSLQTKTVNTTSSSTKEDEHSILAADIISRLTKNEYECIICCDVIRPQVAIWSCENCYMLFHLYCIKKWYKSANNEMMDPKNSSNLKWRCPGCQTVHTDKAVPRCFCGKVKEPQFNPYITPHSCGEICGKMRKKSPDCPHPCNMMCHPGHCPPCSAMGPLRTCFCGATSYRLRCGEKDPGRTCENTCGKTLNCGVHKCEQQCHKGSCGICEVAVETQCYCGKVHQKMKCGERDLDKTQPLSNNASFTCKNPCGRTLDCGNHSCLKTCHKGQCQGCVLAPSVTKTCPCGKIPIEMLQQKPREKCTDPIPTCPNICGKTLACGIHKCKDLCHQGPCKDCSEEIKVPCRCHSSTVTMKCLERTQNKNQEILCNKICKANKSCGRHNCGGVCCPSAPSADPHGLDNSGAHICHLVCGRKLKCGKHDCDLLCHKGRCPPCHTTSHEPYVCECGFTVVEPPILCSQKLPECSKPCVRPRPCGHRDAHLCHSRDTACPPCAKLVDKLCVGGHEMRKNVPCHINGVSCGRLCGKILKCGIHTCKRSCHAGTCDVSNSHSLNLLSSLSNRGAPWEKPAPAPPQSKLSCGQVCGKPKKFCEHICSFLCHPGEECPEAPCKSMTLIFCPCKRRSIEVECLRGGPGDTLDKPQRMLDCDEQCRVVQRNKKLAEAFGINIDNNSSSDGGIYSDLLKDLARACPKFIQNTEHIYVQMIKGLANPKYTFPPMDRLQRQMVHLLAESFRLDTESFERDPHRHVVVTRRKDSRIPNVLLSTIIANEVAAKRPAPVILTTPHTAAPVSTPVPAPPISLSSSWEGFSVYTLHVYELRPEIRSENIYPFLHSFDGHYKLKWLDESNALVVFRDYNQMKDALHVLSAGPWKVRQLVDDALENSNANTTVPAQVAEAPTASKPKEKEPKPLPEFKEDNPFQQDNNYFAALQGEPQAVVAQPPRPKKEKPRGALSSSTATFKAPVATSSAWDDDSENVFAKEQAFDEFVQKTKEATEVLRKEHNLDDPSQVVPNETPAEGSWEQISEQ